MSIQLFFLFPFLFREHEIRTDNEVVGKEGLDTGLALKGKNEMPDIVKAKEVVKETLLGAEQAEDADVPLSAQSKAIFQSVARRDEESGSGELVMGEGEFIEAVAPAGEDYVSRFFFDGGWKDGRMR